ncbi:hypothetical protein [Lacipirellula parvula]|uniref:Uncharacterized protein n=1 Tax=Lacipirellula parvula TaxID=2650471 RepID=A0A5K7XPB9_9BACT|nr:hypothetical protein [Lacipirellula parvula]BBO35169.1 hypothetical protein PLANPX_4781 [Lacipirellula parvula]
MPSNHTALNEVRERLKVRGDTFLNSDGKRLLSELKNFASKDPASGAAKAIKEIEHRRSEKIE